MSERRAWEESLERIREGEARERRVRALKRNGLEDRDVRVAFKRDASRAWKVLGNIEPLLKNYGYPEHARSVYAIRQMLIGLIYSIARKGD